LNQEDKNKILENVKGETNDSVGQVDELSLSNFIIGLSLAVVIGAIFIFANMKAKDAQIESLNATIERDVTTPLASLTKESAQIDTVKQQLAVLTDSLKSKYEYSKFIEDLSAKQYKKSRWTSINIVAGSATITGEVDYFEDLAKAISALKTSAYVEDVNLTQASVNEDTGKIEFGVTMVVKENLLLAKQTAQSTNNLTTNGQAQ
jgi:Tfp pilus assembly protein PilN